MVIYLGSLDLYPRVSLKEYNLAQIYYQSPCHFIAYQVSKSVKKLNICATRIRATPIIINHLLGMRNSLQSDKRT